MMDLGTTITRLRTQRGLSQGDLAEALDVSRQSVSKWETNASVPDLDKLVKLSQFFNVSLDELVTGQKAQREAPPAPTAAPAKQPRSHHTAAIILLCTGVLICLLLTVLGGLLTGLLLAAPFWICAAICACARKRAGLFCAWAIYLSVELYLRWATGLNWTVTLQTLSFTPEMNYMRLAIAWAQLLVMLLMFFLTLRSFRAATIDLKVRRNQLLLGGGWLAWLLLRCLRNWGYPLVYQIPELDFSLAVRLLLRVGDTLLLALFAALLTATVCAVRRPKNT